MPSASNGGGRGNTKQKDPPLLTNIIIMTEIIVRKREAITVAKKEEPLPYPYIIGGGRDITVAKREWSPPYPKKTTDKQRHRNEGERGGAEAPLRPSNDKSIEGI